MILGLRARIAGATALAAVIPTLVVGALAVRRARLDVESEVVRGDLALVRALATGLDGTLKDARRTLSLAAATWADGIDAATTTRLLRRVRGEVPLVRRAALYDLAGVHVAGEELPRVAEPRNSYGSTIVEACAGATSCDQVFLAVQARARTGELMGVLVAELDLGFVDAALETARLGRGTRLWVVDTQGRVVAGTGTKGPGAGAPAPAAVERALAAADEGSLEVDGVLAVYRNLASFETVRGLSWAIVLSQPTAEAYALARATTRDTALVAALVTILALVVGSLVASRLTRPLRRLAAHVDAFAAGVDRYRTSPPGSQLREKRAVGGASERSARGGGTGTSPPERLAFALGGRDVGRAPLGLPADAPGEIGALARRFADMERRVAERERLAAELARSAQLASVGALAAGVAHEINNPLTTILGYANLLLESSPTGHPDHDALVLVAEEARRVQQTVRTLLDHARLDSGPGAEEQVDVNALVHRATTLVSPTLRKRGVTLTLDLGDPLPRPAADARRLERVLVNLAQNAAQALDRGGTLIVRTRPADRGGVAIEFVDDGPGIPEDQLARIFEPFFTTKGPGVGTGLGLAISRQIVLDHGGRIEVQSRLGAGSTFRVVLGDAELGATDGANKGK